jgi:V8-like Glu-specific endopeptidase
MIDEAQKRKISSSVKHIFPTIEDALEIVSKHIDLHRAQEQFDSKELTESIPENFNSVYENAQRGLEKIRAGKEGALTDKEAISMEAIIVLEGRPPILIENNKFAPPPSDWQILENFRKEIEESILSVGRVNLSGNLNFDWVGTAFLVSNDVLMTNKHVAIEFSERHDGEWTFKPGQAARVDYGQDGSLLNHNEFKISGIIGMHDNYDLALLRVSSTNGGKFPEPLKLAKSVDESNIADKQIYVLGFPAMDGRRNDPAEMDRIFQRIYNIKRLQPGTVMNMSESDEGIMFHDASTLGGNSGSCIIDLETNEVIGLHFGGRYLERNHAVALWKLANDPLLQNAGVNFQ